MKEEIDQRNKSARVCSLGEEGGGIHFPLYKLCLDLSAMMASVCVKSQLKAAVSMTAERSGDDDDFSFSGGMEPSIFTND